MTIEVSTTLYQFSHGHKPRGRGLWMFDLGDSDRGRWLLNSPTFGPCLYSEARRRAVQRARENGCDRVTVCP